MKASACVLCALLALPAPAGAARVSSATIPNLIFEPSFPASKTAPAPEKAETRNLKRVRAGGSFAAGSGAGLFGYCLAAAVTGPVGWAAALMFVGGLSSYLADRRLRGHEDFPPPATLPVGIPGLEPIEPSSQPLPPKRPD